VKNYLCIDIILRTLSQLLKNQPKKGKKFPRAKTPKVFPRRSHLKRRESAPKKGRTQNHRKRPSPKVARRKLVSENKKLCPRKMNLRRRMSPRKRKRLCPKEKKKRISYPKMKIL
jgi:hypothetical protein